MGIRAISAAAISTVILGSATAFANPLFHDFREMGGPPPQHHIHECSPCMPPVDNATRDRIEQIMDEERDRMEPSFKKLQYLKRALHKAAMQKPFNETSVRSTATEAAKLETELMVSRLRTQSRIAEIMEHGGGKQQKK